MQTLILTLHIIVCVLLVILVLLQSGKEGMGVIFGGGSSSVFGSGGAGGILTKLTAFMAVLFVITSISYNYVTTDKAADESVILDVKFEEDVKPANADQDNKAIPTEPDIKVNDKIESDANVKEDEKPVVNAKEVEKSDTNKDEPSKPEGDNKDKTTKKNAE